MSKADGKEMSQNSNREDLKQLYKMAQDLPAEAKTTDLRNLTQLFNQVCDDETQIEDWDLKRLVQWETVLSVIQREQVAGALGKTLPTQPSFQLGLKIAAWTAKKPDLPHLKAIAHHYLDFLRTPEFRVRIYGQKKWESLILDLIRASDYSLRTQFVRNERRHPNKALFQILKGKKQKTITWSEAKLQIAKMQAMLRNLDLEPYAKIGFLMTNSPTMAMLDLACLFNGQINIMIPANSTPEHIAFIMNQTEAKVLFVSDSQLLEKVRAVKHELAHLDKAIYIPGTTSDSWVEPFALPSGKHELATPRLQLDELATLMYTSGTTGEPKGIMFNHTNIIYKRFCRALAIPKIGSKDRFLCYLPLFHTFGRYFEMTGCIFWGAEYVFMENPSVQTMISNMRQTKPTVFISIPKKWIQLYEGVCKTLQIEVETPDHIKQTLDSLTGGELRWGLSAAGYLSPEVFQFFQQNGVELMSGFGMTEATGGITMTPPGEYKPNSLGKALPGVELKLAEDGELLIRGAYVMMGYFGQTEQETFQEGGWLPTGDIMKQDSYGCLEIIDRKKEIYKNIRGETVAPQKVENLFRDFEEIQQVFLVGDHRPFNTVLLYPNPDKKDFFEKLDESQKQDYYASVISTVNRFLSPFERILDYREIDRPFCADKGELTPKNTYRRGTIESHFKDQIESMYQSVFFALMVDTLEIRIPNWFLSQLGILRRDVRVRPDGLSIEKMDRFLNVIPDVQNGLCQIGDHIYGYQGQCLDLQPILVNPALWCGNRNLYEFAGRKILQWQRLIKRSDVISFHANCPVSLDHDELEEMEQKTQGMLAHKEQSTLGIHYATVLLQSEQATASQKAIAYFRMLVKAPRPTELAIANLILARPTLSPHIEIRRQMMMVRLSGAQLGDLETVFTRYLRTNPDLLDEPTVKALARQLQPAETLKVLNKVIDREFEMVTAETDLQGTALPGLFNLLAQFGTAHPSRYREIRQTLVAYQLSRKHFGVAQLALQERRRLQEGFRKWLGPTQIVAVDPDLGEEYRWKDVITMEEDIDPHDRERIFKVISETHFLKESVFLFTQKRLISLQDLMPGGVWVSYIRSHQKKRVYRVSIQTRFHGAFDITLNLNRGIPVEKVLEEVDWLILASSKVQAGQTLVEDFGGYYEDQGIWSEEYLVEPTVTRFFNRQTRKKNEARQIRVLHIWPFFMWNATTAFMRFWKMTGYETMIAKPSPDNIIIPLHDYQRGTRLVSLSERVQETSFLAFFLRFQTHFMEPVIRKFTFLDSVQNWKFFFSGVITVEGEEGGKVLLRALRRDFLQAEDFPKKEAILEKLNEFLGELEDVGYNPKALAFAIRRFHRWFDVNRNASLEAQAAMLNELYETYSLTKLDKDFKDIRTRFFLQTVLEHAESFVQEQLLDLAKKLRHGQLAHHQKHAEVSRIIRESPRLSELERYFLTRLSFPHIAPATEAELLQHEASEATLMVQLEDHDGIPFSIRKPISPKEISKLYQLFMKANLTVKFRPEHHFLVAVSERGHIIGGLFYLHSDSQSVHMDKIVVSDHFRRKGISEGLMNEFFNRLKNDHIQTVSTGFFRPEYFYRFGFSTQANHSGLVKYLHEESDTYQI